MGLRAPRSVMPSNELLYLLWWESMRRTPLWFWEVY